MGDENKIKFGLKGLRYASVDVVDGKVSYGKPEPFRGAVNLVLSPRGERTEFYADDMVYFETTANQGYEGTLEVARIPDDFKENVLMEERDANGVLIENANAIPKNIALLFEFNGDKKATRHVNYNVSVARPNIEGETKTQTITPKTETLNISASPAEDTGDVKAKVEKGQAPYDSFFDEVYIKNAVISTVAVPAVEFDKKTPADIAIQILPATEGNKIKDVRLNGVSLNRADLTIDGLQVDIDKSCFMALELGEHSIVVVPTIGTAVTVIVTVKDTSSE